MSVTRRKWWLISLGIAAVIVGVLVLGTIALPSILPRPREIQAVQSEQPDQAQNGQQEKQASDADVRELAGRLIAASYSVMSEEPQSVELLPGALPGDLPLKLKVPQGGRLVGSAVHNDGGQGTGWDVVVDAPGTVEQVSKFYEGEITRQGWKADTHDFYRFTGGFQMDLPSSVEGSESFEPGLGSDPGFGNLNFCQDAGDGSVSITIRPRTNAPNDVQIHLVRQGFGPCGGRARISPPASLTLPRLSAPEGVAISLSGGSGGSSHFSSRATAETEQSVAALEAHFAGQLEKAGWTRQAGKAEDPLAWSTWKVPGDGELRGFLYVLQGAGENRKDLFVQVESASPQFGDSMDYSQEVMVETEPYMPAMPAVTAPADQDTP
ncbi:MAG TPA: hypothetical protein VGE45_02790 [Chloroflexia bacterium]|jgi:hypothetical protein